MSEALPQSRVVTYIMIAGVLPVLYMIYSHSSTQTRLDRTDTRISTLQQSAYLNEKKQAANRQVREFYKETDRFYIDKNVESLSLMEEETGKLQAIVDNKNIAPDPRISRRLDQLKKNSLEFSEGSVQTYTFFKEIPANLTKPVEVDINDLRKILAQVEGVSIGDYKPGPDRPQMLITDFKLDRKRSANQARIYSLTMKLIKREFF